jgi:hypothetical protein
LACLRRHVGIGRRIARAGRPTDQPTAPLLQPAGRVSDHCRRHVRPFGDVKQGMLAVR